MDGSEGRCARRPEQDVEPNESQSNRDDNEATRFKEWLEASNAFARSCSVDPKCEDPRIDKRPFTEWGRNRFIYA